MYTRSHLPAPILVLKCSESLCSCIRCLNYVLASTAGVGLKATASGFAKTRVVCILEQLWRVCFFSLTLGPMGTKNTPATTAVKCCTLLVLALPCRWPLGRRLRLKQKRNSNDELAIQPCSCILEPKSGLGGERGVFPFPWVSMFHTCLMLLLHLCRRSLQQ